MLLDLSILYLKISEMVISLRGRTQKAKEEKSAQKINAITEH